MKNNDKTFFETSWEARAHVPVLLSRLLNHPCFRDCFPKTRPETIGSVVNQTKVSDNTGCLVGDNRGWCLVGDSRGWFIVSDNRGWFLVSDNKGWFLVGDNMGWFLVVENRGWFIVGVIIGGGS